MRPYLQFPVDLVMGLVIFTEEILNAKLYVLCSEIYEIAWCQ